MPSLLGKLLNNGGAVLEQSVRARVVHLAWFPVDAPESTHFLADPATWPQNADGSRDRRSLMGVSSVGRREPESVVGFAVVRILARRGDDGQPFTA